MNSTELAKIRTRLANQRTYLAYMRTGFVISAIAGTFKKLYIVSFGIMMIIISSIQYYLINKSINDDNLKNMYYYNYIPMIYIFLSSIVLYLQYYRM